MKVLVVGSEGFIGSSCIRLFREKTYEVYGCDIIERNDSRYFFIDPEKTDFDPIFKQVMPDVCINASGSAGVGFSIRYPEKDYELNVGNVERMLQALKNNCPKCKFINFSSAAVYGNPVSLPVKESSETIPLSPYGKHKLQSELLLQEYYLRYGLLTCSLRVFSAYGPGLKKQLFWDMYQKTKKGKEIMLFGTGRESRDFIFSDDLVRTIDSVIRGVVFSGEALNVASGVEITVADAAQLFLSSLGDDFSLRFNGEEKQGDPRNWRADISLFKKTGFIPFVTFEEGIKKYAEWVKKSG